LQDVMGFSSIPVRVAANVAVTERRQAIDD
jgi:hypothetical protein